MRNELEKAENEPAPETEEEEKPKASRRRVIVVGAGQTGRALVRILSDTWDISVLDTDPVKLERLQEDVPDRHLQLLKKDGTSLINLREAGIEGAEWIAALTDHDEVNTESCRLALSIDDPPAAVAVVRQPQAAEKLKKMGAEVLTRPAAIAGLVKNRIERAHQVAVSVGLGRGEIVEIPVLPSSPAIDVRVRDLRARRWLVAAIYRGEQLIIPHGHAVIRQGDRLLLTGDPDILPYIGDYLRAGVARFPLQYGTWVVSAASSELPEHYWEEVQYLVNNTRTRALRVLVREEQEPPKLELDRGRMESLELRHVDRADAILRHEKALLDCGCLVLSKDTPGFLSRIGVTRPKFAPLLDVLTCPVLLAAGTFPYRRLVLPVTSSEGTMLASELAIDLSRQLDLPIVAVVVVPPTFIVGEDIIREQKEAIKTVRDVASLYHVKLEQIYKEGNPGIEIADLAREGDLLVISHRAGRRASLFNPDTSLQILSRFPRSVLVLPYKERVHGAG